ncbi:MAG: glycosyltransferase family 4 protein [Eubacteriales bacterium]
MKILLFSNMYPTQDKPQFGIYVMNQVKALEEMGYEFKIIGLKSKGNKFLRYLSFSMKGLIYALIRGKEYHIVHAHYAFPPGWFAMMHQKRFGSKMIVTCHGSDIYKMPKKNRWVQGIIGKILKSADKVICVSTGLKDEILKMYGIDHSKINVVNMGINTDLFTKQNKDLTRTQLNLSLSASIILFVGNFYKAKGILDLIDAFQKMHCKDKLLILLGDMTVDAEVYAIIKKNHHHNIMILPPVQQQMVAKYMNAADVFVLPSYSEGMNLVTLEAMATETLVVVSDIEAFDYLTEDMVIKVQVGNKENLTQGIEKALTLRRSTDYINNNRVIVNNNSIQQKSNEVSQIYEQLRGEYS